jgi:hypothetical protein
MARVRMAIVIAVIAAGLSVSAGTALAGGSTGGGGSLPAFHCDLSSLSGAGTLACTAGDVSARCVFNLRAGTLNCTGAGSTLACVANLLARAVTCTLTKPSGESIVRTYRWS